MINEKLRVLVRSTEIYVGRPLLWSVYDSTGNLLLKSGSVIESQHQIDVLSKNSFFRDSQSGKGVGVLRNQMPSSGAQGDGLEAKNETVVGMEDVRWRIGEPLYLQPYDNLTIRYTVCLIGFVKNKTVMVTAPTLDGKFDFIRDGQTFIIRSFSGKKAYAFTAAAVKSVHAPHPYLHLSYPQQVKATTIRKGSRAAVRIIASVSLGEPARTFAATLIDLSVGGASGIAKQVFGEKGEEGQLKIKLHVADHTAFLSLKVALRSVKMDGSDVYVHGFEFLKMPVDERMILSAFVHQTLVDVN